MKFTCAPSTEYELKAGSRDGPRGFPLDTLGPEVMRAALRAIAEHLGPEAVRKELGDPDMIAHAAQLEGQLSELLRACDDADSVPQALAYIEQMDSDNADYEHRCRWRKEAERVNDAWADASTLLTIEGAPTGVIADRVRWMIDRERAARANADEWRDQLTKARDGEDTARRAQRDAVSESQRLLERATRADRERDAARTQLDDVMTANRRLGAALREWREAAKGVLPAVEWLVAVRPGTPRVYHDAAHSFVRNSRRLLRVVNLGCAGGSDARAAEVEIDRIAAEQQGPVEPMVPASECERLRKRVEELERAALSAAARAQLDDVKAANRRLGAAFREWRETVGRHRDALQAALNRAACIDAENVAVPVAHVRDVLRLLSAGCCRMTCPHGDRCVLAEGHDAGCTHRGCDCNEPNVAEAELDRSAAAQEGQVEPMVPTSETVAFIDGRPAAGKGALESLLEVTDTLWRESLEDNDRLRRRVEELEAERNTWGVETANIKLKREAASADRVLRKLRRADAAVEAMRKVLDAEQLAFNPGPTWAAARQALADYDAAKKGGDADDRRSAETQPFDEPDKSPPPVRVTGGDCSPEPQSNWPRAQKQGWGMSTFIGDPPPIWRRGRSVPLNVYEGDRPVCQCHNQVDALRIVQALNAQCQCPQCGRKKSASRNWCSCGWDMSEHESPGASGPADDTPETIARDALRRVAEVAEVARARIRELEKGGGK